MKVENEEEEEKEEDEDEEEVVVEQEEEEEKQQQQQQQQRRPRWAEADLEVGGDLGVLGGKVLVVARLEEVDLTNEAAAKQSSAEALRSAAMRQEVERRGEALSPFVSFCAL